MPVRNKHNMLPEQRPERFKYCGVTDHRVHQLSVLLVQTVNLLGLSVRGQAGEAEANDVPQLCHQLRFYRICQA
jgi:hypothetical protein